MAIDVYTEAGELVAATMPAGARALGVRVKPILRLAMGHKHPEKGYPIKDDHFTSRGDDRAVAKFLAEYGENPKSVEILLPSELDVGLTIQYRAFKGGAGGEGGTLVAIGQTNFALRDYCGGIDQVTVFNQDGTVEEIETGLDANTREPLDDRAKELGLELYTTLTAMMPGVLGFGSYFALTTKGKESTDNLWLKLRQLYGLFGSKITFAVKPQLVIRPSTARPVVTKDGETKRITTTIYVADIIVPETIDEMIDRLRDRQSALAPGGATAALYGDGARPQLAAAPAVEPAAADVRETGQQAGASGDADAPVPGGDERIEDGEFEPIAEEVTAVTAEELAAAGSIKVTSGAWKDKTLLEIADAGEEGATWLLVQLKRATDGSAKWVSLSTVIRGRLPETWTAYETWKAAQS